MARRNSRTRPELIRAAKRSLRVEQVDVTVLFAMARSLEDKGLELQRMKAEYDAQAIAFQQKKLELARKYKLKPNEGITEDGAIAVAPAEPQS